MTRLTASSWAAALPLWDPRRPVHTWSVQALLSRMMQLRRCTLPFPLMGVPSRSPQLTSAPAVAGAALCTLPQPLPECKSPWPVPLQVQELCCAAEWALAESAA